MQVIPRYQASGLLILSADFKSSTLLNQLQIFRRNLLALEKTPKESRCFCRVSALRTVLRNLFSQYLLPPLIQIFICIRSAFLKRGAVLLSWLAQKFHSALFQNFKPSGLLLFRTSKELFLFLQILGHVAPFGSRIMNLAFGRPLGSSIFPDGIST